MASADDVQLLIDFGIFSEVGLARLANLIRGVQMLAGNGGGLASSSRQPTGRRKRGRPVGSGRGPGRPPKAAGVANGTGKRGRRSSFTATKEELAKLRETLTVKQIAQKLGVSMPTVNLHLKKHGLTTPRKAKASKK